MFEQASGGKKYIKCALWGNLKEGKTRFALSFPENRAVVDTEKGTHLFDDFVKFHREDVIRWRDLKPKVEWLQSNPRQFGTLIVDSITPLYADLVEEVSMAAKNRTGSDYLTQLDWQIIKRRFRAFLRILLELPMHIVITARAKDEYENLKNEKTGKDEGKRTGEIIADVDKALMYDCDFALQCFVDDPNPRAAKVKDASKVKFMVRVTASRRQVEVPKFSLYDITKKSGFDVVFGELAKKLALSGKESTVTTMAEEIGLPAAPVGVPVVPADTPPPPTHEEKMAEIGDFTNNIGKPSGSGSRPGREKLQDATTESLKVLMVRAAELAWSDGTKFSAQDGRALILARYGIESRKEMKEPEVDELYVAFGEILAGRSQLVRRGDGVPEIVTKKAAPTVGAAATG